MPIRLNALVHFATRLIFAACLSMIGFAALILSGCFGSDGDGGDSSEIPRPQLKGYFDRYLEENSNFISASNLFSNVQNYAHAQFLYSPSDISGSGYITSMAFRYGQALSSEIHCANTVFKLVHTSTDSLGNIFADNISGGKGSVITVRNSQDIAFPIGNVNEYTNFVLDSPFYYNGVDNLLLEVERGSCTGPVDLSYQAYHDLNSNRTLVSYDPNQNGGVLPALRNVKFEFNGGDNMPVTESALSNNLEFPLTGGNKIQLLYYAAEINGHGDITGIGFPLGLDPTGLRADAASFSVSLKLGHSQLTSLNLDFATNYTDAPVVIANHKIFDIPGQLPELTYVWFPVVDSTFNYNGNDNLVLEVQVHDNAGVTYWKAGSGNADIRHIAAAIGSATAVGSSDLPLGIKLRFAGATADIITDGSGTDAIAYNTSPVHHQYLFRATEIGSSGYINRAAYRLKNDVNTASSYNNCRVILGHRVATTLDNSFSGNMVDSLEVYSGDLHINPALAGDWIEIPFTAMFLYDGQRSLVYDMSCAQGSATNNIRGTLTEVATRYPSRRAYHTSSNTEDIAQGVGNYMVDFRVWFE